VVISTRPDAAVATTRGCEVAEILNDRREL